MNSNSKYKILVVEDEATMLNPLVASLIKESFNVVSATDGVEGLSMSLKEKPDLILLDISMPNMNGVEMMQRLRESGDYGKNVKIILLTSLNVDDNIMKGIVEGMPSFFLTKDTSSIADIIQKVKESLEISIFKL